MEDIASDLDAALGTLPTLADAIRIVAAMLLGGLVGWEREHHSKPAGLRTHMLVSIAACLFILVGTDLGSMEFGTPDQRRIDPLRLIEAVTAGVAFLAAGLIFTSGGEVRNVTTGASLWLSGAIGLACGAGQVPLAVLATAMVLGVLAILGGIERRRSGDRR